VRRALERDAATACFWGYPEWTISEMFDEMVSLDEPGVSGNLSPYAGGVSETVDESGGGESVDSVPSAGGGVGSTGTGYVTEASGAGSGAGVGSTGAGGGVGDTGVTPESETI